MAGRAYALLVKARGDTRHAQGEMQSLSKRMAATGKKMQAVGRQMSMAITLPAVLAAGGMVKLASDAEETANLLEVTFGGKTRLVTKQLDEFAAATGESRYALREVAGEFGALLKPMGLGAQATADMSGAMTQLAVDIGSFRNLETAEVMEKLRSGLVGEAEPLRSLGILINANTVAEKAYAAGIAERGAVLTEQQKVQARYLLIMEQTTDAQGDAERTSGSMARRINKLKNSFRDIGTELGRHLLPVAEKLSEWVQKALDWFGDLSPSMQKVILAVVGIAAAIGPLLMMFGTLAVYLPLIKAGFLAISWPVLAVAAAVAVLVGAFVYLYRNNEGFRKWVHAKLIPAFKRMADWLKREVPRALDWLKRKWNEVWPKLKPILDRIANIIWRIAKVYFPAWWAAVRTAWAIAKPILIGMWERFGKVIERVRGVVNWLRDKLKPVWQWFESDALPVIEKIAKRFGEIAGHVKDWADKAGVLKKLGSAGMMGPLGLLATNDSRENGSGDRSTSVPKGSPGLNLFTAMASRFGLMTISGYRPGDDGWHGVNRARDYSNGYGPTPQMLAFARFMAAKYGGALKELIYTPLGFGIKNGQMVGLDYWGSGVNAMHNNHVHVAYARGGVVTRPHMGLVGEAGPEAIVPLGSSARASADRRRVMSQAGLGGTTIQVFGITDPVEAASVVARKQRMMQPAIGR